MMLDDYGKAVNNNHIHFINTVDEAFPSEVHVSRNPQLAEKGIIL